MERELATLRNPYKQIFCEFRDKDGTFGSLMEGLKKFENCEECSQDEKGSIGGFIEKVECLRAKVYDDLMAKLEYIQLSVTREDFERYHGKFHLRVKTNITSRLEDLTGELTPGNQLWMMRKGCATHKSYAHVAIVSENNKYIHVTAPSKILKLKSKAVIQEELLDNIDNVEFCFVVKPPEREDVGPSLYLERAKVCKGIQFDYDAVTANCETFCQFVHGEWDGNFQNPTGGGQQLISGFTKVSKLFKSLDKPLKDQMKLRIREAALILPNENF